MTGYFGVCLWLPMRTACSPDPKKRSPLGAGGFVLIAFVCCSTELFFFLLNGGELVEAEEKKKGGGERYGKHGGIPFDGLFGVSGGLLISLVRRG